jgi:hypothetical protein
MLFIYVAIYDEVIMKNLLLMFLIGQMLIISFIYGQSIYDIYLLNNMG